MSYKASFLDNQVAGVDDFNGIITNLLYDGVTPAKFNKDEPYTLSQLNDVTKAAIEEAGVVPSSETALRCSIAGSVVTVNAGTAVFSSGVVFTVTGSEKVNIVRGMDIYVYLLHSFSANKAYITYSETPGVETETEHIVPLCHINPIGTLTDMRRYAIGKLKAVADWNGTRRQEITITKTVSGMTCTEDIELLLGGDKVNFLVFVTGGRHGGISFVREVNGKFVLIDKLSGGEHMKDDFTVGCDVTDSIGDNYFSLSNFRREDNKLMCTVTWYDVLTGTSQNIIVYSSVCGGV